jgi:hypothetical protein
MGVRLFSQALDDDGSFTFFHEALLPNEMAMWFLSSFGFFLPVIFFLPYDHFLLNFVNVSSNIPMTGSFISLMDF